MGIIPTVSSCRSSRTNALEWSLPPGMKTTISAPPRPRRVTGSLAVICTGAIGLLAGCASYPESHVVSAPPPPPPAAQPQQATVYTVPAANQPPATHTVTQTQSGTTVAYPSPVGASSIVVMQAPPQAQQEVPSARPSRDHVWIPGYWSWRTDRYEWMAGHWQVPSRFGAVWVPPRWQPEGTSWRYYEGYWD